MDSIDEAVERFEDAVRAHEMRGAQMPEDQPYIKLEYKEAKAALLRIIRHEPNAETQKAMREVRA